MISATCGESNVIMNVSNPHCVVLYEEPGHQDKYACGSVSRAGIGLSPDEAIALGRELFLAGLEMQARLARKACESDAQEG